MKKIGTGRMQKFELIKVWIRSIKMEVVFWPQ